jgi:hypothetical protein
MYARRLRTGVVAIMLATVGASPGSAATCQETSINTGDPATTSVGNPDWRWVVVSSPLSATPAPAYVVNAIPQWYAPPASEPRWISASGQGSGTPGWGDPAGTYTFRTYWYDVPGGGAGVWLKFAVDNAVEISLNGYFMGRYDPPPGDLGEAFRDWRGNRGGAIGGGPWYLDGQLNFLDLKVDNYWASPEGLFVWGGVRQCV